jgi:hypothetical protein
VIDCKATDRKHQIAETYLAEHQVRTGVFLILVARAPALVWKVSRSGAGVIHHLEKTRQFVNHYSFHIVDPTWGRVTIKVTGHPPFGAQVIQLPRLRRLRRAENRPRLRQGGELLHSGQRTRPPSSDRRHLVPARDDRAPEPVIDRWIYTACVCFGLNLDEQQQSRFVYDYSIYQVEYSRNLLFTSGAVMDRFQHGGGPHPIPARRAQGTHGVRQQRPSAPQPGFELSPRQAVVIERPQWNLTIFKVRFGLLTLKAYTKGERVLRFEAIVHNTKQLGAARWTSSPRSPAG